MLDLGFQGKTRPVVTVSREDNNAAGALSVFVPLTKESRGGQYEVTLLHVPWLKLQCYANVCWAWVRLKYWLHVIPRVFPPTGQALPFLEIAALTGIRIKRRSTDLQVQ